MRKLLLLLLGPISLFAQNNDKTCDVLSKVNKLIQKEHFQPKALDDSLSVYVFDTFIDQLDEGRNTFTKAEYIQLSKHRLLIDDYIVGGNCAFLDDFITTYEKALVRKKNVLEKLQDQKLEYNSNDTIKFSREKFDFDLADADFERVWNKRLRFEILEDISKVSGNFDSLQQNFSTLEKAARIKILDNNICRTDNLLAALKGDERSVINDFLNIFCSYFDPHTSYFSHDAKDSFLSMLSTSNLSLGLNVGLNEKEEIVVEEIIPGGPAAKSQMFEKKDVIVRVSNKKGLDFTVSCTSMETIGNMIFSDANLEIELSVRKKNGKIVDVTLQKEILKATANNVYSFVVDDDSKIGYIRIPSFYSDFESGSIHGCAEDVYNEIVKLQDDNINGLIIDLLDNGGGSMDQALTLAGMFIESGPVSVLVNSKGRQQIIKDSNPASAYKGPIVVLMNGNSASASEFFAGALQDYNRAIVMGSSSLGKATMQTFLPLRNAKQESYVKLTIEKFYRITGGSNQIKGIIPDVRLPVLFDSLIPREKSFKTALKFDSIHSKAKFHKYKSDFTPKIALQSRDRVNNDPTMKSLENLNTEINRLYNNIDKFVTLSFKNVFTLIRTTEDLWEKVKKASEAENASQISHTTTDLSQMQSDDYTKMIYNYRMTNVKTNPYIPQAAAVIKDYIQAGR